MGWTNPPRTWTTLEFVTVGMMNVHIRDQLLAIDTYLDTACIAGSTIMPLICDSLGGTDSHRPVVGGVTYSQWHLCNGNTDIDGLGYTAPDMRDYFPVGAGSTYAQGATGGALAANYAHTHAAGTLVTNADAGLANHTHTFATNTAGPNATYAADATGTDVSTSTHQHAFSATSGNPTTAPTHTHTTSGTSASAGSATQDTTPAYRAQYLFLYIG